MFSIDRGFCVLTMMFVFAIGSPFQFNVMDVSKVSAMGDGLQLVAAGNPTSFTISAPGAKQHDIQVNITCESTQYTILLTVILDIANH